MSLTSPRGGKLAERDVILEERKLNFIRKQKAKQDALDEFAVNKHFPLLRASKKAGYFSNDVTVVPPKPKSL